VGGASSATVLAAMHAFLQGESAAKLWFADENALDCALPDASNLKTLQIISNRFDVCHHFSASGANCEFSDFVISPQLQNHYAKVFYRISKEKPLVHHLINQAFQLLQPDGELILCGEKNEGIKSYFDKAKKLFNSSNTLKKSGSFYSGSVRKKEQDASHWLADNNYPMLRPIGDYQGTAFFSKPGVFGWNKIDQGSAFLLENYAEFCSRLPPQPTSLLDLGCGYGFLTIMATKLSNSFTLQRLLATDNNAAAINAARHNFHHHNLTVETVADDCGRQLVDDFDIILCNPPFHQGFSVDGTLTEKFLSTTKRRLSRKGAALFVVNRFIPLEKKARTLFSRVNTLAQNKLFNVIALQH
jgi:16S rRNA (guanine1207-N2)-methyltransferase